MPHTLPVCQTWGLTQGVLALQVWDADMIHGCDCDIGWEGADCSLRTVSTTENSKSCRPPPLTKPCVLHLPLRQCIRSDDHMTQYISGSTTVEQETEVQLMLCDADGGWFTLQLDGRVSQRIYTTYNEIQVKDALEVSEARDAIQGRE